MNKKYSFKKEKPLIFVSFDNIIKRENDGRPTIDIFVDFLIYFIWIICLKFK